MMIWIAFILLLLVVLLSITKKWFAEGFDPFLPELRPEEYPDQTFSADLLLAEKYIQKLLKSTSDPIKTAYLTDFLNLLQFI